VDGAPAIRAAAIDEHGDLGDLGPVDGAGEPGPGQPPVERESESTRTQGLFTGSAEAAERARGFTRPTEPGPRQQGTH
jgi:hypothetical protein